jgi:hypothetical protein
MKPPDKPALIDSHNDEFRAIRIYPSQLTKPLLQRRGRGATILCAVVLVGFGSLTYILLKSGE